MGDSGVGKTTLSFYFDDSFDDSFDKKPTVGVNFICTPYVSPDNKQYNVQIWDTAGQELYASMIPNYARDAECILIVYDITNQKSFDNITNWLKQIYHAKTYCTIAIFVNNTDLEEERCVSRQTASNFVKSLGLTYFEGSALTKIGISEVFDFLFRETARKKTEEENQTVKLTSNANHTKSCC